MVCYYNFSSAASANALDGLSAHSIIWIHHIHVAGGASGPATMVAVCCGCCRTDSSLSYVQTGTKLTLIRG
jgi:hypothetical protein